MHKKRVIAHLKARGIKPNLTQVSKVVAQATAGGFDPLALVQAGLSSIPFVGGIASEALGQAVSGATMAQNPLVSGMKTPHGLAIIDLATGKQLRRVSMEDYFYLKSLSRRRKLGTHHRSPRYAVIEGSQKVVKV